MAEALGVDMRGVYARVFTLGTALGTLGGALVIPATAAMSEMGIELIVEAFAVVVIGGLGSMRGALRGRARGGRAARGRDHRVYPELEMLLIYLIVIAVLAPAPARALRRRRRVRGRLVLGLAARGACSSLPLVRADLPLLLMLPFMAYGVVLLGLNLLFGYTGLVSFGHALFIGHRRLHRRLPHRPLGHPVARGDRAGRRGPRRASWPRLVGAALRALREDLLRHAHARVRHGLLHLPAQVLPAHRRRRGHAGAAAPPPRAATSDAMPKTDYLVGPYYYYSLGGPGRGRRRHVADRALALRALPAHDPRQPGQGRGARRRA